MNCRETISPWLERLAQIGLSQDQAAEHWSAPNRYLAIQSLLTVADDTLSDDLKVVRQLLTVEPLRIQDCAAGTSQAIIGLSQQLRRVGIKLEVSAFDISDPQSIVFPGFERDLYEQVTYTGIKSALAEPDQSRHYDLSILGYLHPYLSRDEFQTAILNRLSESKVVAIIPADDSLSALSVLLF